MHKTKGTLTYLLIELVQLVDGLVRRLELIHAHLVYVVKVALVVGEQLLPLGVNTSFQQRRRHFQFTFAHYGLIDFQLLSIQYRFLLVLVDCLV